MVVNLEAAKELVKRYRSIELSDIHELSGGIEDYPYKLTGFGNTKKCSLCTSISDLYVSSCALCIYSDTYQCMHGDNEETYEAIAEATTATELIQAFRDRADHIENIIKRIEDEGI